MSADKFVGFFLGSTEDLSGDTWNINLVIGELSVSIFLDKDDLSLKGGTIGSGPSVTAVGASGTHSTTGKLSINDGINALVEWMYGDY